MLGPCILFSPAAAGPVTPTVALNLARLVLFAGLSSLRARYIFGKRAKNVEDGAKKCAILASMRVSRQVSLTTMRAIAFLNLSVVD